MRCATLQRIEFNTARLYAQPVLGQLRQVCRCSRLRCKVTKRVNRDGLCIKKETTICVMDTLADNYNHIVFLAKSLFNSGKQCVLIKRNLGQKNEIRGSSTNILRQRTSCREPAGVTTHGLDKRDVFAVVDAAVAGELGGHGRNESRRAAKAWGVIGVLEVVVDGFWHAYNANRAFYLGKVSRQLIRGVHGIVSADIEYGVYLVFLELRINLLVDRGDSCGF